MDMTRMWHGLRSWLRERGRLARTVLLALVLVAANALLSWWRPRLDFTSEGRFTLSQAMRSALSSLGRPVTATLYWSRQVAGVPPSLQSHGAYVASMLEEYARRSGGKLELRVLDPVPGSAAEQRALEDGIVFRQLRADDPSSRFCLGVSFRQLGRPDVSLRQLLPQARNSFEYEVTKALERLRGDRSLVVAVLSDLPLFGGVDMERQRQLPEWAVVGALREANCELRPLAAPLAGAGLALDADVEVLLLVQPPALSEASLRSLDAFVQRGGRLLAFLDPACWTRMRQQGSGSVGICSSELGPLLKAWGVTFETGRTVLDRRLATIVANRRGVPENHVEWLTLGTGQMNAEDGVTAYLQHVELFYAGAFAWEARPGVSVSALLSSTSECQLSETARAFRHQSLLERDYRAGGVASALAVSVEGRLPSAFGGGTSPEGTRCILVGDADCLQDTFLAERRTDNLQLLLNCLDALRPDGAEMMALRNRSFVQRGLTRLDARTEEARRQFQERLEAAQQERGRLQEELAALESRGGQTLSDAEGARVRDIHGRLLAAERSLRALQVASGQALERHRQRIVLLNLLAGPGVLLLLLLGPRCWRALCGVWGRGRRPAVALSVSLAVVALVAWRCLRGMSVVDESSAASVVTGDVRRARLLPSGLSRDTLCRVSFRGVRGGDFSLVREGGSWGVQERGGFPVSVGQLNQLVESLNVCEGEVLSLSCEELGAVGLSPAVCEVAFTYEDGSCRSVRFGGWRRDYRGEPQGRYLSSGEVPSMLTDYLFRQVGLPVTHWLNRSLPGWSANTKRVARVSEFKELGWCLEQRPGGYEVQGRVPRGRSVSAPVVQNIVDSFRRMAVLDVTREVTDFRQEVMLEVIGEDDVVYRYVLGHAGERWYARLTEARSAVAPELARRLSWQYGGFWLEIDGRLGVAFRRTRLELFGASAARGRE
ncbi:MAG: Gldg family protein [Oligosphaeraceae bacterium]